MSSPALVACDMDRTIIYSRHALWLTGSDQDAPRMVVAEVHKGAPLSFMTRAAEDHLLAIKAAALFVPVTTRTLAQYRRIQLPGTVPEYAVTSNGGTLLHHGVPDEAWHRKLAAQTESGCAPLETIEAYLANPDFSPWLLRRNRAEDLFSYAIVDREAMPAAFVRELEDFCAAAGWSVSVQGRKLYCVPEPIKKSVALAEVARRAGASRIIAAGDSLLDQDMLAAADIAYRPIHGELHETDYRAPHLRLTSVRGVLAGEEILANIRTDLIEE